MARVRVFIEDHTGKRQETKVAADTDIEQLIPAIVTSLRLPTTDPSGTPVTYHLAFDNRQLHRDETLISAGVVEGAIITVVPESALETAPVASSSQKVRIFIEVCTKTESTRWESEVATSVNIEKLIPAIVDVFQLPVSYVNGTPVTYHLAFDNRQLQRDETLISAGVVEGATIAVVPESVLEAAPIASSCQKVRIFIEDHTVNKMREARVAADTDIAQLIPAIVTALRLPTTDLNGTAITYHLTFDNRQLPRDETLTSAGVLEGATITVVPEIEMETAPASSSSRVGIFIEDHTGNKRWEAKVAADTDIERLIPAIVTALRLPTTDPNDAPITYHLAFDNRLLHRNETLTSAGVTEGEMIAIVPEMTAGCFLADTKVWLANGYQKAIKEIQIGDAIISNNPKIKSYTTAKVVKVFRAISYKYLVLNEILHVTESHPIWANEKWVKAGCLKIGDSLQDRFGNKVELKSIIHKHEMVEIFNLHVSSDEHTFFAEDILVHNAQSKTPALEYSQLVRSLRKCFSILEIIPLKNQQEQVFISLCYEVVIIRSSEMLSIGEESEVLIDLRSINTEDSNAYIFEVSQNEATGNDLNIILTAPGFLFNNDNTTSLPIDPDTADITQTATFNLTAVRPGKTKIQAELYVGEIYKTTLETEVEVTAFESTQLRPLIAARSRPVPQPNLILQVRTQWNADISACTFNYHVDSYQPRLLFADGVDCSSQSVSAIWVERTRQLLKSTLEEAATSQPEDFRSRLASFGQYLWRSLFPEELQSTFRTVISLNHPFTLLIIADRDAWFPWELFHDGQKFLGDRLIIGRWFWELEKARPYEFPVGAVNVAHYASVEQPELWTELLHSSGAPPPVPMEAGIFHDMSLFESIRGLHLIRYGQSMEAANLQGAPVRVDSDRQTEDIEREVQPAKLSLRRNHPLVSLSYVNRGRVELTALEQTWASTFVGAGCSAFVGSLWAVDFEVEAAFISAFYHGIWAGQSLGVAFNAARRLAQAAVPESGDWLAYVLFGDPMARPYRPVNGQGYAVVEAIGQEIDDPVAPGSTVRFRVSLRRTPPVWYENRLMEVAEDLTFEDLRVFIVTSGLQVTPGDSFIMTPTATGDYLGWFMLTVPPEMENRSVLVQVYFEDGIEPVHHLRFSLKVSNGDGV
jgi:Fe2+ transport system protein FeoA